MIDNVFLAGFDGFSLNKSINYFSSDLINHIEMEELVKKNEEIRKYFRFIEKSINIHFVTTTIYHDVDLFSKSQ